MAERRRSGTTSDTSPATHHDSRRKSPIGGGPSCLSKILLPSGVGGGAGGAGAGRGERQLDASIQTKVR